MYKFINEGKKHLHTYEGKPLIGISTVIKMLAKPLTWWAAGMAVGKLGWTNSKLKVDGKYVFTSDEERLKISEQARFSISNDSPEEYLKRLDEAYRAHDEYKDQKADEGVDRHLLLENYVKSCLTDNDGIPLAHSVNENKSVSEFTDWAIKNIKKFLWSEVHGFSLEHWTGGIADVGWIDKEGRVIAGDFKSSKDAYLDQFIQIGGYDLMLSENGGFTAEGEKIFTLPSPIQGYCVIPFGQKVLEPILKYDVDGFRAGFKNALGLHKLNQLFTNDI